MIDAHDSSSKVADVDDLPDVRMEASSPGPRVTFNIQDTVTSYCSTILHANGLITNVFTHKSAFLVKDFKSITQNLPLPRVSS